MFLRYSYRIGIQIYNRLFPPPPPPPTCIFGSMPDLVLPSRPEYKNLIFTLETPTGDLPELPLQANVYFMPKLVPNIRSLTEGETKARQMGFVAPGTPLSDTLYRFTSKNPSSELEMNIATFVYSINYDLTKDPDLKLGTPPNPQGAINVAAGFMDRAGLKQTDISGGTPTTELLKVENGNFVSAISLSETDVVKVNFYRNPFNELPVLPPDPKQGNIWYIIGGSRVLTGEYHYYPIDDKQLGSYPLITPAQAWDELKSGQGFIARLGENLPNSEIKIRRVYLAYYDTGVYAEFLQPVIVFEGDNDFYAYVHAILNDSCVQQKS